MGLEGFSSVEFKDGISSLVGSRNPSILKFRWHRYIENGLVRMDLWMENNGRISRFYESIISLSLH